MIMFRLLKYKNLLSTGDKFTEIDFTKAKNTLIVGSNGSGKSTILDAIAFALFGKPHRNINKPQLVNSINNKNTVVEVDFDIGKSSFKIIRGIKPTIFEIWKDNVLLNQDSHNREYQKVLEQNILKLNHKSFHQIVVLGSSSFIPFMQLTTNHRREVIEDLLDIGVFSKMNVLAKERINKTKELLTDNQYQGSLLGDRIISQKKYIKDITAINDEEIAEKTNQISDFESQIKELQETNTKLQSEIMDKSSTATDQVNKLNDKRTALIQYKTQFDTRVKEVVKHATFYEKNDTCPTCTQPIEPDLKKTKLKDARSTANQLDSAIHKANEEIETVQEELDKWLKEQDIIREKQNKVNNNNREIGQLQKSISIFNNQIDRLTSRDGDLGEARDELKKMKADYTELQDDQLRLREGQNYNMVIAEMLKDTGIKTKVVNQYVPIINKLVNHHLQILDFFVHFELDGSFNEQIRSRHRDIFSYDSFSEGEKQRIDLALLFTWRMIAKMKNSVATNLLILDETFDSSMDQEGVDNLMKILYNLEDDTNTFVISHKGELLDGRLDRKLEFQKKKNFSIMKEII